MEGRPHVVDLIKNKELDLIVNTTEGRQAISDSYSIRREALNKHVNYYTTISGAEATVNAIDDQRNLSVYSLADVHREIHT